MDKTTNSLNWFEIPAADINRSQKFYETIFQIEMSPMEMGDSKMAFFPWEAGSGKATGALVEGPMHKPSQSGAIIYLNANPDLNTVIEKVEAAGGKIVTPKFGIGEFGFSAYIQDTEGNQIALHSNN